MTRFKRILICSNIMMMPVLLHHIVNQIGMNDLLPVDLNSILRNVIYVLYAMCLFGVPYLIYKKQFKDADEIALNIEFVAVAIIFVPIYAWLYMYLSSQYLVVSGH